MLVSGTAALFWKDVISLPTLAYENDPETTDVDFKTLRLILSNGNEQLVLFSSEEERKAAVELILEIAPHLKP